MASITANQGGTVSISTLVHPDILQTHILTRLDGPTLASASCASTEFHSLASQDHLWTNIIRSTWPSTDTPRLNQLISTFPNGTRSFFSCSFPLLFEGPPATPSSNTNRPSELISAVDIYYRDQLIFSRVVETETESAWFHCSPFRIDMLEPKDTCPTLVPYPETEESRLELAEELTLSWILIDAAGRRAVNLSSHKPVAVERHWLNGEVHARFSSVVRRSASEFVECGILVTCGRRTKEGRMQVREVSLQVEDMDGMYLNGKYSLGILVGSFEGKKGIQGRREEEGRKRHERFLVMKRARKEKRMKTEETLDILCVAFGVLILASFGLFVLVR